MISDENPFATGGGLRLGAEVLARGEDALVGTMLGEYRLVEVIGDGGMSRVYRGERADGSFERQVAIKVAIGASMGTELQRRFGQEQALLAALAHPHICRLYDARMSPHGQAYIVMELIEGETVDAYCDARGNSLDLAISLLLDLVAAVAYAHAHLIVHRDIKPGNVMVDRFGQPKLLDFGIAKLLDGNSRVGTLTPPLTPQFASPEQLLGKPVTIASDIYQLGALLYRLLAGRPLSESAAMDQAIDRASRGEDPPIPAEIRQTIPKDLQLIIERCLRWEPQARYPSADALRKDLEAFQGGYPVEVASGSFRYRCNRFLKRNRAMVALASVALLLLTGATFTYTRSLAESRELAEARAQSATRTSKALSRLLTQSMSDLQDQLAEQQVGASGIVRSVFEEAIRLASQELGADDDARAELIRVRANAEWRLGRLDEAADSFRQAAMLSSADDNPAQFTEIQLDSIRMVLEERRVDPAGAALAELEGRVEIDTLPPLTRARFHRTRGYLFHARDEFDAAATAYRRALELLASLGSEHSRERADLLTDLAWVHMAREQFARTRDFAREAVALLEESESPMSHRLINPLRTLALALGLLDDYEVARQINERALQVALANYGETHRAVGRVHSSLSSMFYRQGDIHRAIEHEEEALRIEQALYGGDSWDALVTRNTLVLYLGSAGRIPEALADSELLLAEMIARDGPEGRRNREVLLANRSRFLLQAGAYDEAVAVSRQSLSLRRELQGKGSYGDYDSQRNLSYALVAAGRIDEARALFESSLAGLAALRGTDDWEYESWSLREYLFDRAAGDVQSARDRLQRYVDVTEQQYIVDSPHFLTEVVDLAEVCLRLEDGACASRALGKVARALTLYPDHPDALRARLVEAALLAGEQRTAEASRIAGDVLARVQRRYPLRIDLLRRARSLSG